MKRYRYRGRPNRRFRKLAKLLERRISKLRDEQFEALSRARFWW